MYIFYSTIVGMIDAFRRMSGDLDTTAKDDATVSTNTVSPPPACDDPIKCPGMETTAKIVVDVLKTTASKVVEVVVNNITNTETDPP